MANEIERKNIPFTNEHFVSTLLQLQALGSPYWYGTCMYRCKDSLLKSKAKQYPSHYTSSRMSRYKDDVAAKRIASDCVGAIKGYCWTNGGEGLIEAFGNDKSFTSKYGSNNCPDKSANGMFEWAKKQGMDWGTIDTIPELPGVLVRYDGHVGVYAGDGKVVEWRGFKYGSQVTELKKRGWKHWYKHPAIRYGEIGENVEPEEHTLGDRLLKRGMKGSDVEMLQRLLTMIGYELEIDGDYGPETEKQVRAYQLNNDLEGDGKYGDLTHKSLMDDVADYDAGQPEPEDPQMPAEPLPETPEAESAVRMIEIVSKGGRVNIRAGNGTQYAKITAVGPGNRYPYVATAVNGWHAIEISGQIGWVSGEYAKMIGG